MKNGTGPTPDQRQPLTYMTIRVYQVDRYGTVTADRGKVLVPTVMELKQSDAWPPCACPRHRAGQAVRP
ncbi:hypothetical protein ABZ471_47880 [Streptomyces sp. NPDC005728]|uniref:hypothetical protein n=1 Tax=Streptomyces sp. NPDC005728 TaxID=3157054 RepID=UPI0033FB6EBF